MRNKFGQAGAAATVGLIVLAAFIITALLGCIVFVESGFVGVKKTFGKVHDKELDPGIHGLVPFVDSVEMVDTRIQKKTDGASASSKDLQVVTTNVTITYSPHPDKVGEIVQTVGNLTRLEDVVLHPAVPETLKAVTAKYTAEELITKRAEVKQGVSEALVNFIHDTLKQKGIANAVEIHNVAITDFDFSDEFNKSIEAKVKAEQDALRAKNEKLRKITEAEAEAESVRIQSIAKANAIKREANALKGSPEMIKLKAIEKWGGEVPKFTSGQGAIPLLNMGDQ